jgi:periplasmic divalent cation tolerance protein
MHVIVLVTCPDEKTAGKLSDLLLDKRLAACVNVVPGLTSKYWWKGKLEKCSEVLMIIKTRKSLVNEIEKAVKQNHPYDVPEVIAIPIVAGSAEYLDWIESETS